ncbi:class I SAM-dependent methyltransferase [Halovulum dunhuangense]|uniref:Class I SAM-dependent methyltransferase n=1 Tax=Halovulum dunhuangense TaxID=1505036 RepID=A0A849L0A9_9RHOB|nr:methyltransferase [Halovulum dunhuangense]NNU79699.1 class I SAM-dependent methyltransferase [Halovulum dunhuangense]
MADSPLPAPVLHVTGFRPDHDAIAAAGGKVAIVAGSETPAMVVACLPRNRMQAMARIAEALRLLPEGGWLLVDGQKTDGIEPVLKALRAVLTVEGVASKAHGKIAWAQRPPVLPAELANWTVAAEPARNEDGFWTAPGMFSAEGIDPATALLTRFLPEKAKGAACDLGAGWGALSSALLATAPGLESCDLVEAEHAALEAAKRNVTDPRARFRWADVARWEGGPYDLVVSNPPFHVSRNADPDLGRAFIAAAARLLTPRGRFLMVANRQLPYEATIDAHFHNRDQLHVDGRFKILSASQPRGQRGRKA